MPGSSNRSSSFSSPDDGSPSYLQEAVKKGCGYGEGYASEEMDIKEEASHLALRAKTMEDVITNVFSVLSSLKIAYMQLQAAHSPYDAGKLQSADRAVIMELRKLSELKHAFKDRKLGSDTHKVIRAFHAEMEKKASEIEALKALLVREISMKENLERKLMQLKENEEMVEKLSDDEVGGPTKEKLEDRVQVVCGEVRRFSKLLVSLMGSANWDLDAAAASIQPGVLFARRAHKRFAFESFISHCILSDFQHPHFGLSKPTATTPAANHCSFYTQFQHVLRTAHPLDLLSSPLFADFCRHKYLDVIHPTMEQSLFGKAEQRESVKRGEHPDTRFYHTFLALAKSAWALHLLAFSFDPPASIFQVKKGADFSSLYMQDCLQMQINGSNELPKVGFTVMPGFRLENTAVVKCQVYLMQQQHQQQPQQMPA